MNTYLSVDLDFWNFLDLKDCRNFMKEVKATNLPITLVDDHADLLKRINKRKCSKIINIDYHSDICNNFDTPPIPVPSKPISLLTCLLSSIVLLSS